MILFREIRVQIVSIGISNIVSSLATLSVSLFLGIFMCPGTYCIHSTPGQVYSKWAYRGHLQATSQKALKTDCKEPIKGARSLIMTLQLSRKTQRLVVNLIDRRISTTLVPLSTTITLASNTSVLQPRENTLQLAQRPYQQVIDPMLVILSIDLLLDLSEKTYILLGETIAKKSVKSLVAYSLVCSYSLQICFLVFQQDLQAYYRGFVIGFTNSILRRIKIQRAKYILLLLKYTILFVHLYREQLGLRRTIQATKVCITRLSQILEESSQVL